MAISKKAFKEWNAVVEALGQGKQTIVIRIFNTKNKEFLLYPTFSYARNDNYLENFKKEYKEFAEENAVPKMENNKTEIKYFAKIEKIIEIPSSYINRLDKYHIWDESHVKSYLGRKNGFIWVLRVYKLKKPGMVEQNKGMLFANLENGLSISNSKPVLSDKQFLKIMEDI